MTCASHNAQAIGLMNPTGRYAQIVRSLDDTVSPKSLRKPVDHRIYALPRRVFHGTELLDQLSLPAGERLVVETLPVLREIFGTIDGIRDAVNLLPGRGFPNFDKPAEPFCNTDYKSKRIVRWDSRFARVGACRQSRQQN